jgi:hypothetical protein
VTDYQPLPVRITGRSKRTVTQAQHSSLSVHSFRLQAKVVESTISCDTAPCLVEVYQRFGSSMCLPEDDTVLHACYSLFLCFIFEYNMSKLGRGGGRCMWV